MTGDTWTVMAAMSALGIAAQAWRATSNLPNWAIYPMLLACAVLAQWLWGMDTDPRVFARHVLESWLMALGTNRITSDAAKGSPLETRRTASPQMKEES